MNFSIYSEDITLRPRYFERMENFQNNCCRPYGWAKILRLGLGLGLFQGRVGALARKRPDRKGEPGDLLFPWRE